MGVVSVLLSWFFRLQHKLSPHQPADPPTQPVSMVHGNVLGSSGSVVPLFRRQIASGGPLTLTHPEIIRYFMTISKPLSLYYRPPLLPRVVICSTDKGEPVRIKDLAEQMVRLSGLPYVILPILKVILTSYVLDCVQVKSSMRNY